MKMNRSEQVYQYTCKKLKYLSDMQKNNTIMAELRHGIGKEPGEIPELWGIIFDEIPDTLIGYGKASYAEWAIYTALTLYALHQQGKEENMYEEGMSLGRAASHLVKDKDDDIKRITNRLNLVVTSVSPEDLAYHLRGIIQLLKSNDISLDYARLAKELYMFHNRETASAIKISWGRDFYGKLNRLEKEENDNNE
ncbi:MAG: type I-E CRISPR-associated protein Cse2/CasB [Prevotella sp.]|nr:type I-E CRISPR-associated protein Cse2/CasB [Alistipes senegalensis]MCM1357983.1 type I-E CRISPR-associated protein Cse2/CasB [Prevotella sp.]